MGQPGSGGLMAALRLIDALPDFGAPVHAEREARTPDTVHRPASPPQPPAVDIEGMIRAAVARAEEALAARLAAEHEAALQAERKRYAEELQALARSFGDEAGATIAARLAEIERGVGEHVSAAVARLLGGILSGDLQRRSLDSLAKAIAAAVDDADAVRIEVRGPQSLFSGLSTALAGHAASLHHVEADGFDLSVTIDGTVFETRLSEWSAILSEVLS
jgi:hypothetical protein